MQWDSSCPSYLHVRLLGPYIANSVLTLGSALAVQQYEIKEMTAHWTFAFAIMATLFIATCITSVPGFFGKELTFSRETDRSGEREPFISNENED